MKNQTPDKSLNSRARRAAARIKAEQPERDPAARAAIRALRIGASARATNAKIRRQRARTGGKSDD